MLNRPRLIEAFRDEFLVTQASAASAVDWIFSQMADELSRGGEVSVRDFGRLTTKHRAAGEGHNPRTGEKIQIAAKTVVRFKAGLDLARRVNGG